MLSEAEADNTYQDLYYSKYYEKPPPSIIIGWNSDFLDPCFLSTTLESTRCSFATHLPHRPTLRFFSTSPQGKLVEQNLLSSMAIINLAPRSLIFPPSPLSRAPLPGGAKMRDPGSERGWAIVLKTFAGI